MKQIVNNVEEQARADFAAAGGISGGGGSGGGGGGSSYSAGDSSSGGFGTTSYSYSRTYRTTSGGQGKRRLVRNESLHVHTASM